MIDMMLSKPEAPRSSHWPTVRAAHLVEHPKCESCGCDDKKLLEVHHIRPYHVEPALELEPKNLITLCESPSHNCHLIFGHFLNWRSWNTTVNRDASRYRARVLTRPIQ
jgi:5-methylcytosine-specific restriction protein A